MHKEVQILSVKRSKYFDLGEQAVMGLLFLCGLMQIAAMVGASSDVANNSQHTAMLSPAPTNHATLLAKK